MTDIAEQIRAELAQAAALDEAARQHRRQAGRLLAQAREQAPSGSGWHRSAGVEDGETARLLIEMAAGGVPAGWHR